VEISPNTIKVSYAKKCETENQCEEKINSLQPKPMQRVYETAALSPNTAEKCEFGPLPSEWSVSRGPGPILWAGRCFDGFAQGPGMFFLPNAKTRTTAHAYLINGKPLEKFNDSNKKFNPNKITLEHAQFLMKLSETSYSLVDGNNGEKCKVYINGLVEDKEVIGKLTQKHGESESPEHASYTSHSASSWFDNATGVYSISHWVGGPAHRLSKWSGDCKNGLIHGAGVITAGERHTGKYPFEGPSTYEIVNANNGHIDGIMKSKNNRSAFFYRTLWFSSYSEYMATKERIESLLGKKDGNNIDSQAISIARSGFKGLKETEEDRAIAEAALKKVFNMSFAISGSSSPAERWNESLLGLSMSGVTNSSKYYINWKVSPHQLNLLPTWVNSIKVTLSVNLTVHTQTSGMGVWSMFLGSRKEHNKTVEINLHRKDGFNSNSRAELFDVQTYYSTGSESGMQIKATDITPTIKLLSVKAN